mgnify:CR=1 FL=1
MSNKVGLQRLLNRLGVVKDSVILVHESDSISKLVSREYLASLQALVSEGTISMILSPPSEKSSSPKARTTAEKKKTMEKRLTLMLTLNS